MEDSQEIKKLRLRLGLTMREMARLLHTTATSVHRWEHGSTPGPFCTAALGKIRERLDTACEDGRSQQFKEDLETASERSADAMLALLYRVQ